MQRPCATFFFGELAPQYETTSAANGSNDVKIAVKSSQSQTCMNSTRLFSCNCATATGTVTQFSQYSSGYQQTFIEVMLFQ